MSMPDTTTANIKTCSHYNDHNRLSTAKSYRNYDASGRLLAIGSVPDAGSPVVQNPHFGTPKFDSNLLINNNSPLKTGQIFESNRFILSSRTLPTASELEQLDLLISNAAHFG
jgi:hypothetical protein